MAGRYKNPNYAANIMERYNWDRRMIDHRVPFDFHFDINKPVFSTEWARGFKQKWLGNFFNAWALYATLAAFGVNVIGVYADWAYRRYYTPHIGHPLDKHISPDPHAAYIHNHSNRVNPKGEWNHNFYCWSNEPNCGRDFDLPKNYYKK